MTQIHWGLCTFNYVEFSACFALVSADCSRESFNMWHTQRT